MHTTVKPLKKNLGSYLKINRKGTYVIRQAEDTGNPLGKHRYTYTWAPIRMAMARSGELRKGQLHRETTRARSAKHRVKTPQAFAIKNLNQAPFQIAAAEHH